MSIGAINHSYNYQNTYYNHTVYYQTPTWKPKMRDFGDECIISEKNDGDNDIYRNVVTGATASGSRKGFSFDLIDLSSLVVQANKNNQFIGSLSSNYDVDYLKIDALSQMLGESPISVTMKVPEGCDYNMTVYDKDGNQVGKSVDNGDGTKTVKIPCDWSNSRNFVLKIEKADGTEVKADENYTLTFEQGEMSQEIKQSIAKMQSNFCEIITDSKRKLAMGRERKRVIDERNATNMKQLHKEQYEALPEKLQYTGSESAEQMLERKKNGEVLTDAEEAYVKIYGNINDIQEIEAEEASQRFQDDFKSALEEAGISPESSMHVSISSAGKVEVTGMSKEDNETVQKLIEEKFMQQIKNSYLTHSEKVEGMGDYEYQIAGYVEELDRFLDKASGGRVTVDDLSIQIKSNGYISFDRHISGLPGNIANLINNADADSNYNGYKQMIYDVLGYKQQNDTIPRYDVNMDVNNGIFSFI